MPGRERAARDEDMRAYDCLPRWMRLFLWDFPVEPHSVMARDELRRMRASGMREGAIKRAFCDDLDRIRGRLARAAYGEGHPSAGRR